MLVFLIAAFVIGAVSLGTAWWSYSATGGGGSNSLSFYPGGNYDVACTDSACGGFSSGSFPYSAIGGSIGGLYEAVLGLMIAAVLLIGIVTAIAVLGWLGRRTGWWERSGSFVLTVLAFLFAIAAVAGTVAAQPGSFGSGTTFPGLGHGTSPLTSFWGADGAASWGAGAGWYLGAVMTGLLVAISAVLVLAGHRRLEVPERRARTATAQPVARAYVPAPEVAASPPTADPTLRGYTAPPPARPYTPAPFVPRSPSASYSGTRVTPRPPPRTKSTGDEPTPDTPVSRPPPPPALAPTPPAAMIDCPECGTANLAKSRTCSYCQRPLRS